MDLSEIERAIRRGLKPLAAAPPQRLSQWADEHFYLSAESSYGEERWSTWPPQRAVMDCMSNDDIREVVLQKPARVGYTKQLLAFIAYNAQHRRRNQAAWQPTDEDAKDWVKTELEPMLRDVRVMEDVFPSLQRRDRDNTLGAKRFLGSVLHIRGGKAAKNYRRLTVDVAMLDELDGFDLDVEKEGSPVALSAKRIEGATYPKHVLGSTPKIKQISMICARFDQAERRMLWHTPCPACRTEHVLSWGGKDEPHGMKWTDAGADSVRQLCPHCGALYSQQDYLAVWSEGRWIDQDGVWIDPEGKFRSAEGADGEEVAPPRSVGFHMWTGQFPQAAWSQLVIEFFAAVAKAKQGDVSELKSFVNTTLGEGWAEDVEEADEDALLRRSEDYPLRVCPHGVLILTANVDTQDNRWEIDVWGWGIGVEVWVVDHMVIHGNPADEREWDRVDAYLSTRFPHAGGQTLAIEAAGVDSGGHFTHQAYQFCRTRKRRRIFATKGSSEPGKPIRGRSSLQDVNLRGKVIKRGVRLWMIGTDTAKDLLFGRLQILAPGPGYIHLPRALVCEARLPGDTGPDKPSAWLHGLTAEVRVPVRTASGEQSRWVKRTPGARNEPLDNFVGAAFAAEMLDLPRYTDTMWARLEERVYPMQGDLLRAPAASPGAAVQTSAPPAQAPAASPGAARGGVSLSGWKRGG